MSKPEIPNVSLGAWKRLWSTFRAFAILDPWDVLTNEELFGVENPATRKLGYGCVMGALGQVHGLRLYRSEKSLEAYQKIVSGELDPESDQVLGTQDALVAELAERKYLEPPDFAVLEILRVDDHDLMVWPRFRSHVPGHHPWFLTEAEAEFLTCGLRCAVDLVRKVDNPRFGHAAPIGTIPIYRYAGNGKTGRTIFKQDNGSLPRVQSQPMAGLQLDVSRVQNILQQSLRPDSTWEADVFAAPMVINDRARPYIPLNVLVAQQASGFVFDVQVEDPESALAQMIADAILRSIERHHWLPSDVLVRDGKLVAALSPLSKALGVPIREALPLRSIDQARRALQAFMKKKR